MDMEAYIFENDIVGVQVAQALLECSSRGVCVRLLVDGFGSYSFASTLGLTLGAGGVLIREYHPLPWNFSRLWDDIAGHSFLGKFSYLVSRVNKRNHRKLVIIDGQRAWVGSVNIAASHLSKAHGGSGWIDTAACVEGAPVGILRDAFENLWMRRRPKKIGHLSDFVSLPVRLNDLRIKRRALYRDLLRRIRQAKERVWIANSYFVPERRLLYALSYAASRGVDVRVMVPAKADVFFIPWFSAQFYDHLLSSGVKVFEYQDGVLHTKTMLIDSWVLVGSSNLNHRSLLHDLEVDLVLSQPDSRQTIEDQFASCFGKSHELKRGLWSKGRGLTRAISGFAFWLRYWM